MCLEIQTVVTVRERMRPTIETVITTGYASVMWLKDISYKIYTDIYIHLYIYQKTTLQMLFN